MGLRIKDLLVILAVSFLAGFSFVGAVSRLLYIITPSPPDYSKLNALKGVCLIIWAIILIIIVVCGINILYEKLKPILEYEIIHGD
jgi:hypothetical protein